MSGFYRSVGSGELLELAGGIEAIVIRICRPSYAMLWRRSNNRHGTCGDQEIRGPDLLAPVHHGVSPSPSLVRTCWYAILPSVRRPLLICYSTGPNGVPYYYNALTQESTYVRPVAPPQPVQPATKKEKAHLKTPIPGTDWIRVTTTEGNVFYNNKATKQSMWTVPEDLKAALEAFQAQELKAVEPKAKPTASSKRKAEEAVPVDEVVISKKTKVEDEDEEGGNDEQEEEEEDEEEEEWQREAGQQLAAEAEEEKKRAEERAKEAELEAQRMKEAIEAAIPARVDLSIEEGKALFKVRYSLSGLQHTSDGALDIAPRKRYQSITPLGFISTQVHPGSPLCPSSVCRCST